jgi:hypothetical protein
MSHVLIQAGDGNLPTIRDIGFNPEVQELIEGAQAILTTVPVIHDPEQCELIRSAMNEIGELGKLIDKQKSAVKSPYFQACKKIDQAAKKIADQLERLEGQFKLRLTAYATEIERRRAVLMAEKVRQEQAAAAAEPADAGFTTRPIIQTTVEIPESAAVATTTEWELIIDNPAEIPREFLDPSRARIIAEFKTGRQVAGCRYLSQKKVVNR